MEIESLKKSVSKVRKSENQYSGVHSITSNSSRSGTGPCIKIKDEHFLLLEITRDVEFQKIQEKSQLFFFPKKFYP